MFFSMFGIRSGLLETAPPMTIFRDQNYIVNYKYLLRVPSTSYLLQLAVSSPALARSKTSLPDFSKPVFLLYLLATRTEVPNSLKV